jgi:hypothetical protein
LTEASKTPGELDSEASRSDCNIARISARFSGGIARPPICRLVTTEAVLAGPWYSIVVVAVDVADVVSVDVAVVVSVDVAELVMVVLGVVRRQWVYSPSRYSSTIELIVCARSPHSWPLIGRRYPSTLHTNV